MPSKNRSKRTAHQARPTPAFSGRMAIIVLAGCLVYLNSLGNPFIFDDVWTVTNNEQIRDLTDLVAVLSPAREMPTAGRPVVNLAFAINYAIGGLNVVGYRIWNILTHVLCALLLLAIVRRTLAMQGHNLRNASSDLAFAVALIWTLHPLNTDAVDYVTQRTELMMAFFYLLTLYASIRALDVRRRGTWTAIAIVACALGMGSKESMVTAPVVVVLFDRVFVFGSFREAFVARSRLYGGLATTWLLLAGLLSSGPRPRSAGFSTGVTPWTYLLNQLPILSRYLGLAVWPRSLVQNYGWPRELALQAVLPYGLFLIGLFALTVAAFRNRPKLAFLGAWAWLNLAPASSIVPIATEVGAERRMYLPLMALVVLAVLGGASLSRRTRRGFQIAVLAVVSTALAAGTIARNREYSSALSLARTTLARYPTPVGHYELGNELLAAGHDRQEALRHLRQALPGAPRAHYTLGVELFLEGNLDEAIVELQAFIREQPYLNRVVEAHEYLGKAYGQRQQWPEAIAEFQAMLAITPGNPTARYLLAETYFSANDMDNAVRQYQQYIETEWNDAEALNNLGVALASTNRLDEAIVTFFRAVEINLQNGPAERNLGQALYLAQRTDEALVHARRAVAIQPEDPGSQALLRALEALE